MTYRPVQWRLRYNAGNVEKATGEATDCPDADPVQGIEYSAAGLHEILYGEESE